VIVVSAIMTRGFARDEPLATLSAFPGTRLALTDRVPLFIRAPGLRAPRDAGRTDRRGADTARLVVSMRRSCLRGTQPAGRERFQVRCRARSATGSTVSISSTRAAADHV